MAMLNRPVPLRSSADSPQPGAPSLLGFDLLVAGFAIMGAVLVSILR